MRTLRGATQNREDPSRGAGTAVVAVAPAVSAIARTAVVDIKGVTKNFSEGQTQGIEALHDINLSIGAGEFVSLIGPSGCGKSTLLRLVADLTQPTSGRVSVNGHSAHEARVRREYGMVFQAPVLFDWRTVERNVGLPLEILGQPKGIQLARVREMLALVSLSDFASAHPWQLSGGMQQRVAIARALVLDPALLLMDEPFGALDEMSRERMNLELHRVWQQTGSTILFVTHSIPEAVFLSTRVAVMSARPGRILDTIPIHLGPSRTVETRETEAYFSLVTKVRECLRSEEGPALQTGTARTRVEGLS